VQPAPTRAGAVQSSAIRCLSRRAAGLPLGRTIPPLEGGDAQARDGAGGVRGCVQLPYLLVHGQLVQQQAHSCVHRRPRVPPVPAARRRRVSQQPRMCWEACKQRCTQPRA
jgi:hypothetical protein